MDLLRRLLAALPLLIVTPLLLTISMATLALTDLTWRIFGRRRKPSNTLPDTSAVSLVIPNWNGRDLLERYLPSVVVALAGNPRNEIIVVDNASSDGSAEFVGEHFPGVTVLPLPRNEGFGGGSNAGFAAARNDVVILLNSDMRVERDFLAPLLAGFTDSSVFSVTSQIFLSDPNRRREETGLTQGRWERGRLRVRHREDPAVTRAFPCFYGGGGSTAFDRRKFLELGGFDPLLSPFYLEDTDLGYMAWKRGWKVLYEPRSIVYHEHRGTIGKKFSQAYIDSVLKKNFLLFAWKNVHHWPDLLANIGYAFADSLISVLFGDSPERANLPGIARACLQNLQLVRSRWRARNLGTLPDQEAFRRPLAGYFRDRFDAIERDPERLSILFVSPYPICPPVHGGAVFMHQTTRELARISDLNLVVLLDQSEQRHAHDDLVAASKSAVFFDRLKGVPHHFASPLPHAVVEFRNQDLEWVIHRQIYLEAVDVVQLEYMPMGQYAGNFERIATFLFEHDIYFQSVKRQIPGMSGAIARAKARFEYLRSLHYELELLPRFDRVQVCSTENRKHIESFLPALAGRLDDETRAGIDAGRYCCDQPERREAQTMLFVGSFRHQPNQEGMTWFTRRVLPIVLRERPNARVVLVGADPPPRHALPDLPGGIEIRGYVDDVREPLRRYAVFICPILSGSGVRVKLLEAFAAGIPVVSTRLGAEGLADRDGDICALADSAEDFARKIIELFDDPEHARQMAAAARRFVAETRDIRVLTERLERTYRSVVREKRAGARAAVQPAGAPSRTPDERRETVNRHVS